MSLNKVILIGNVGADPVVNNFESGKVANIRLATSERGYKLPNGTEVPERTEWHNVVIRRETADFVEKYVKKGSMLAIEGKIHTRSYEKDGQKRYVTEIIADKVDFFNTGRRQDNGEQQGGTPAVAAPAPVAQPQMTSNTNTFSEPGAPFLEESEDGMPF